MFAVMSNELHEEKKHVCGNVNAHEGAAAHYSPPGMYFYMFTYMHFPFKYCNVFVSASASELYISP